LDGFADFEPNLFRFSNIVSFKPIYDSLRGASNFAAVNKKTGNGSLSRALDTYKEFLETMGTLLGTGTHEAVSLPPSSEPPTKPYGVEDILQDGCFLPREELETILERLQDKKNLILQGPPGTGKTWLAKRLAYALVGSKNSELIRSVQFHAAIAYEDFVRGWRPAADGKLRLCNGPFLEMVKKAKDRREESFVIVIEEINRGNPAQIFGELLTLLEEDKRKEEEALFLCHQDSAEPLPVYIPENLHVIGTMNIADRSLALVDYALRRRFAFVTLVPCFDNRWLDWMTHADKAAMPREIALQIAQKMNALNERIASDTLLGQAYAVGHSYVTTDKRIENPHNWFLSIVETELEPLLKEYWFDNHSEVKDAVAELKSGIVS
jgi:5-methylcytosine-specific restriction protein B